MLDKLKDIVPEVDENKANFIYEKSKVSKTKISFSFNYKLVLRFACLLLVLIPVIVIVSMKPTNNKSEAGPNMAPTLNEGEVMEPEAPEAGGEAAKPGLDDELDYYNYSFDKNSGILELYFYDYYSVYYIKEHNDYNIISVFQNEEEVISNDFVYCVNSLVKVYVLFDLEDSDNKILISISNDNINFQDYCIYVE